MLDLVLFNFLLKNWNGRVNGILIQMSNNSRFTGLQSVWIQTVRRRKIDPNIIRIQIWEEKLDTTFLSINSHMNMQAGKNGKGSGWNIRKNEFSFQIQ